MTDWATDIAQDWDPKETIATALRKARADGLRDAAGICGKMARKWTENNFRGTAVGCLELQNILNGEAHKAEKGET